MEAGSGEAPPKNYRRDLDIEEFKARQGLGKKPKQSLVAKARNFLLAGIGIAGAGAGIEATAHPVETTVEKVINTAATGAENIKQAGEGLVDFYNEDPAIRQKSEEIAGKLNGTVPLSEGEQIFEKVKIVPAGDTNYSELQDMAEDKTLINVRNYPGTGTPDGRFSSIIGKLSQGTIIENVILVDGTRPHPATANEPAKWWAFVYRPEGSDPNKPGKIGFTYGIYGTVQAVEEAASSTPAPSETPTNQ